MEELQKDPWSVPADQRPTRCTSTALSIAASLLGACVPGSAARIMAFVGGPATEGPAPVRITDHGHYCAPYCSSFTIRMKLYVTYGDIVC